MAAVAAAPVRYSCPEVAESEASKNLPWEKPVPVNAFWNGLDWVLAANFLREFTEAEVANLPIDPSSTASTDDKVRLLLSILDAKQAAREAAVAPRSLAEAEPDVWRSLVATKIDLQGHLGLNSDAGKNVRLLIKHFPEDMSLQAMFAAQLEKEGEYAQAEKAILPVVAAWDADARLKKASPQAIGARRSLLSALWKQGPSRRADTEALLAEIKESIQGMAGTRFEVYIKEEEEELDRLVAKLSAE